MFSGIANFAFDVDRTFLIIISIALFILIGITVTMIVFASRYNRKRHPIAVQFKDNLILEIVWTVVPLILVLLMFYYGYKAFLPEHKIPKDAIPIKVIAKMWNWSFDYGDGILIPDTLVVPLNKSVKLDMVSVDVYHNFYIPAFSIKENVVPELTTHIWFIADKPGIYEILCSEFFGLRHSYMSGYMKVIPEVEYNFWITSLKTNNSITEITGLSILKQNDCLNCHSTDGSKIVGPSFINLYKSEHNVILNEHEHKILVDAAYIKNSILNPNDEIAKGYSKGLMKSYKSIISDSQITEIIKFLESISNK
jgi:cytochrome c oxidase subunit II